MGKAASSSSAAVSTSASLSSVLMAVGANVADFVGTGIKERTAWHLRHLQQPLGATAVAHDDEDGSDEGGIRVAHCVLGRNPAAAGKHPGQSRRKPRRTGGGLLVAGSLSPPADSFMAGALASSVSSGGGSLSSAAEASTPTVTLLDWEEQMTASPSLPVPASVDEDHVQAAVLAPSTQVSEYEAPYPCQDPCTDYSMHANTHTPIGLFCVRGAARGLLSSIIAVFVLLPGRRDSGGAHREHVGQRLDGTSMPWCSLSSPVVVCPL